MHLATAQHEDDLLNRTLPLDPRTWTTAAPRGIVDAAVRGDRRGCWKQWVGHLSKRTCPLPLVELLPKLRNGRRRIRDESPLLWGLAEDVRPSATLLRNLQRGQLPDEQIKSDIAPSHLGSSNGNGAAEAAIPSIAAGIEALAWCHALPRLASTHSRNEWWRRLAWLVRLATDSAAIDVSRHPLPHQLFAGELPLTLAYLFPEFAACGTLLPSARRTLSRGMEDLLSEKGHLGGCDLPLLRPLLACWTRAGAMVWAMPPTIGDEFVTPALTRLATNVLRLTRPDDTQVFSCKGEGDEESAPRLLATAIEMFGDASAKRLALKVLPKPVSTARATKKVRKARLPKSSFHCESSGIAFLRSDWSAGSPRLALAYGQNMDVELCVGRETMLVGPWSLRVTVDGKPALPTSDWREIGWVSRRKAAYVEFEIDLPDGRRVQRIVVLPHRDRCLFLADAILGDEPAEIEYEAALPLSAGASFREASETRDGVLSAGKQSARLLPLALPEWRIDPRGGTLAVDRERVVLRQKAYGANLLAPLWIDLNHKRGQQECTWRQLTVADNRRVQRADEAVGYRVQAGDEQWLVYRSLIPVGNRTLLGHNLVTSFLVGRFTPEGTVKPLVEIE